VPVSGRLYPRNHCYFHWHHDQKTVSHRVGIQTLATEKRNVLYTSTIESMEFLFIYLSFNYCTERHGRVLYILEAPGSNLGSETRYPHWGFLLFSSVSSDKFCNSPRPLPSTTFPFRHSLIIPSLDAILSASLKKRRYINWKQLIYDVNVVFNEIPGT
jgi:hypothetical protein